MARPRGSKKVRQQEEKQRNGRGKLVGYVRVSTTGQAAGHSLAGQDARLRAACKAAGYALEAIHLDIASGGRRDRAGLREAQARVEAGECEGLVVAKLDRATRSMLQGAELVAWARDCGYTLLSADEGMMVRRGELANEMLPFALAMAEAERERIKRRTREALDAAKAKGVKLGRPAENVGEVAKRAVAMRRKGRTCQYIADRLNAQGYRTARGAEFKPTTVWRMVNRVSPEANPEGGYGD